MKGKFDIQDNRGKEIDFNFEETKIPLEVIKILLVGRSLHLVKPYIVLTRHPKFSGHLSKKREKLEMFSEVLGQSISTTRRQLRKLHNLGVIMEHETVWMAVGANYIAAQRGFSKCKFVKYNQNTRPLAFAAIISEQLLRMVSIMKKERKQTQDSGDGFNVNLSASYVKNYLSTLGIDYSTQEISKQRRQAKDFGMLDYWRKRQNTNMAAQQYRILKKYGDVANGVFIQRNKLIVQELPSVFTSCLHVYSRGISNELKQQAGYFWSLKNK